MDDLLGIYDWSVGYELTESQEETAQAFWKMWSLIDEAFDKQEVA